MSKIMYFIFKQYLTLYFYPANFQEDGNLKIPGAIPNQKNMSAKNTENADVVAI